MLSNRQDKKIDVSELLHAWELGILSEEDARRFELHLLEDDKCFAEAQRSSLASDIIKNSSQARDEVDALLRRRRDCESARKRLGIGRFLRGPTLAWIAVCLLIYPAYLGLTYLDSDDIRPVHNVSLFPSRSASGATIRISPGKEGVLSFIFRGAMPGKVYRITLTAQDRDVLLLDREFSDFDNHETGRLVIPAHLMQPGLYRLIIIDPELDEQSPLRTQEYNFSLTL